MTVFPVVKMTLRSAFYSLRTFNLFFCELLKTHYLIFTLPSVSAELCRRGVAGDWTTARLGRRAKCSGYRNEAATRSAFLCLQDRGSMCVPAFSEGVRVLDYCSEAWASASPHLPPPRAIAPSTSSECTALYSSSSELGLSQGSTGLLLSVSCPPVFNQ